MTKEIVNHLELTQKTDSYHVDFIMNNFPVKSRIYNIYDFMLSLPKKIEGVLN